MKRVLVLLILLGLGTWGMPGWAGPGELTEQIGSGEVNWAQGILAAKGSGAPPKEAKNIAQARLMAERAALADARRNLLETLREVRVDSETRVENYMTKSDEIRLQAEGFIQGSTELKDRRRYLSDGAVEVTVAVNLRGDFLRLLLTSAEARKAKPPEPVPALAPASTQAPAQPALEEPKKPEKPEEPAPVAGGNPPEPEPAVKASPPIAELPAYTGVVVDTRGRGMQPALIPKILDENGKEIYQASYVTPAKAAQNGLAFYTRDLTAAQTNPRVGKNPLTIKALKINPSSPTEIILSGDEAQKILPFARPGTFLEECRVMVVLD